MHKNTPAPFAYSGLDRTIHEKARLSILTALISTPKGLSFGELKQLCDLTDGNLSRHIKVLENAGLVAVQKGYENSRPHTSCSITTAGQEQFLAYVSTLEQVVKDAVNAEKSSSKVPALTPLPAT